MNKFNIEVTSQKPEEVTNFLCYEGKITIGDYTKYFSMATNMWTLDDYRLQWKEGIERIKTHEKSCLVAEIRMLKTGIPCLELWKLYKVGETIFFNLQLLGGDIFKKVKRGRKPYYLKTCYQLVDERLTNENGEGITEYGQKMFELSLNIKDLDQLKFNE